MSDFISREAALKAANEWVSEACMAPVMRVSRLLDKLQKVPAADIAPVVHGKWIPFHSQAAGDIQYCSACDVGFDAPMGFCPHCGARMDGWMEDAEK